MFFSLISTAFSSVIYGTLLAAAIMLLLYFILRAVNEGIVTTPLFYVTGIVLAVLLTVQMTLLTGAVQAKDTAETAQLYINQLQDGLPYTADITDVTDSVHDMLNGYILRRVWWSVGFVVAACGVAVFAAGRTGRATTRRTGRSRARGRGRTASRRHYDDF